MGALSSAVAILSLHRFFSPSHPCPFHVVARLSALIWHHDRKYKVCPHGFIEGDRFALLYFAHRRSAHAAHSSADIFDFQKREYGAVAYCVPPARETVPVVSAARAGAGGGTMNV